MQSAQEANNMKLSQKEAEKFINIEIMNKRNEEKGMFSLKMRKETDESLISLIKKEDETQQTKLGINKIDASHIQRN